MVFILSVLIFSMNSEKSNSKMIFFLISKTTLICLFVYIFSKSSWLSASLFLVMVGGLMILFSMVASIYPKVITNSSKIYIIFISTSTLLVTSNFLNSSIFYLPSMTFQFSMSVILIIILILNIMLIFISKLVIMPLKPFRSLN